MKCKKIFALLLSLCMIASTFVALPVSAAATTNVIDINAPLDAASELTWVASSAVTVSNADDVGGRNDVVKVEGLADSNNNTAGIKLPDGFVFAEDDVLTYSVDVYSDAVITPNMWIRDHSDLAPFAVFNQETIAAKTWTTVEGTVTYDEMVAKSLAGGSTGAFNTSGNYALYIRPAEAATVYLDNFKIKVARKAVERETVVDITVNSASDITWKNGGTAADANGIGGRNGVIALGNLANANGNTAGVKLPDGFAFQAGDVLTYSFDVYSDTVTNPDIWLRNHGSADLKPFATFYHAVSTGAWTTVTKTVSYDELITAAGENIGSGWTTAGNYALYIRPRQSGTVYVDNFKVTVSRLVLNKANVVDLAVSDASDITWKGGDTVTATDANGIGGRDGVVALGNLANSNTNTAGVKLPDGFAFKAGDVLTYSLDVYSDTVTNPDIWVRNHGNADVKPFATFFNEVSTGKWTTVTKTVSYDELVTAAGENIGSGWTTAGNYALYIRPRQSGTVYVDNFTVTVTRTLTGEPTVEKLDYVTYEDGKYIVTTASVVENEAEGARSSQVRVRIIPEQPVSTSDNLKVSFDFKANGILNSLGEPYATMTVNLRLYDSVDGSTQANTIGYINASVPANVGAAVPVEYYIEDMVNGGGASTLTEIKSIGVQVDMYGAGIGYAAAENDGYFTISNIKIENEAKGTHEHSYSDWTKADDDNHQKICSCGDVVTEAHTWNAGVVTEPSLGVDGSEVYTCRVCKTQKITVLKYRKNAVNIEVADANDITWKNGGTAADANGIGGRDGVVALGNLANSNGNTAGVKLPDGFAFQEDDILTYSFDVYSDTVTHPDVWVRNHNSSLNPFSTFYHEVATGTWTTVTKTVTYDDLMTARGGETPTGDYAEAGNYALYIRPRESGTVYVDNFTVTVSRVVTGVPTVVPTVDYVTETNGVYKITTADVVANDASGATSSLVRLRILPEVPVSKDGALKVSFDFKADGILNSEGNPYEVMSVNLRIYDSADGSTQANTIGYIKNANAIANTGDAVTLEFYIENMENGGGASTLTDIASIGIQVDMYGASIGYAAAANDGYFEISNVKITEDAKAYHTHAFIGYKKAGEAENNHAKICGCSYQEDEAHIWDDGVEANGVKTYTCVCGATYTEEVGSSVAIGDANEDGEVTVKDVIQVRRFIAGGYDATVNETAADATKDGEITVKDVIQIRRFIAGGYDVVL